VTVEKLNVIISAQNSEFKKVMSDTQKHMNAVGENSLQMGKKLTVTQKSIKVTAKVLKKELPSAAESSGKAIAAMAKEKGALGSFFQKAASGAKDSTKALKSFGSTARDTLKQAVKLYSDKKGISAMSTLISATGGKGGGVDMISSIAGLAGSKGAAAKGAAASGSGAAGGAAASGLSGAAAVGAGAAIAVVGVAALGAGAAVASKKLVNFTKDAATVEAQLDTLNRTMGDGAKAFAQWAEMGASSIGISKQQAAAYGSSYANLLSGFVEDSQYVSAYTQKLMQASAVIASKTGRDIEDVNMRLRSGLLGSNEAIEDIGVNVLASALETTDAFKRIANGRGWADLAYQEQQQIRLLSILEQSTQKYGNEMSGNTASGMQVLEANLANLKLRWKEAFLPVTEHVLPILNKLVNWLSTAALYFKTFMEVLFGKSSKPETAMGGAVKEQKILGTQMDKTAKKAKKLRTILGIDQINQMQGQDEGEAAASSPGGASALYDPSALEGTKIDPVSSETLNKIEEFRKKLERVKEKLKPISDAWKWLKGVPAGIAQFIKSLFTAEFWTDIGTKIKESWDNFISGIKNSKLGQLVKENWDAATTIISDWWKNDVAPWFTKEKWQGELKKAKDSITNSKLGQAVSDIWNPAKTTISGWWKNDVSPWFTKEKWTSLYSTISTTLSTKWGEAKTAWSGSVGKWWKDDVSPWFTKEKWQSTYSNIVTSMSTKWGEFKSGWGSKISSWWKDGVAPWFTLAKWKELGGKMKEGLTSGFQSAITGIVNVLNKIIGAAEKGINSIIAPINSVIDKANQIPGLDLGKITPVSFGRIPVPAYASGGVLEPNRPKLYLGGDNRREREVVSPESLIYA